MLTSSDVYSVSDFYFISDRSSEDSSDFTTNDSETSDGETEITKSTISQSLFAGETFSEKEFQSLSEDSSKESPELASESSNAEFNHEVSNQLSTSSLVAKQTNAESLTDDETLNDGESFYIWQFTRAQFR